MLARPHRRSGPPAFYTHGDFLDVVLACRDGCVTQKVSNLMCPGSKGSDDRCARSSKAVRGEVRLADDLPSRLDHPSGITLQVDGPCPPRYDPLTFPGCTFQDPPNLGSYRDHLGLPALTSGRGIVVSVSAEPIPSKTQRLGFAQTHQEHCADGQLLVRVSCQVYLLEEWDDVINDQKWPVVFRQGLVGHLSERVGDDAMVPIGPTEGYAQVAQYDVH
jgi:hypothetical protein